MTQLSLFGQEPDISNSIIYDFAGIEGLVYSRNFISVAEQFELVQQVDELPWQNDLKRRVQHYGYKYDYKSRKIVPSMYVGSLPEFAINTSNKLVRDGLVNQVPDQLIINEYHPGQGISPHVDCEPCFSNTVVTISLGSEYLMDFIEVATGKTKSISLELGSALVLSKSARYDWKHGIKARKTDNGLRRGRRISLTFRTVILEPS